MKKFPIFKTPACKKNLFYLCILFTLNFFCSISLLANPAVNTISTLGLTGLNDSLSEKKVDYLEKIYFSGENKEGLRTRILITIQEFQNIAPTTALARQLTFLLEIQDRTNAADDACEILDLLAVGIFNIDAAEAARQGVRMPSEKAKAKSFDAVSSLNKLGSTSGNLSNSASNLAWSNYLLSGGKSSSFTTGASKVASTAGTVTNVAGSVGQVAQTGKAMADIAKGLGIGKKRDRSCNDVAKKDIEIGPHGQLNTSSQVASNKVIENLHTMITIISIPAISNSGLRAINDSLNVVPGIRAEKSYNEAVSTITVTHPGTTDKLADWFEDKFGAKYKLLSYSEGKISLAVK